MAYKPPTMDPPVLPDLNSYEDEAIDTVAYVMNSVRMKLGTRLNLFQLSAARDEIAPRVRISVSDVKPPLALKSEKFIDDIIKRTWLLTEALMYVLKYQGCSTDETSVYYYFEAVFSQPTPRYPVPQATASVFFRLQNKQGDPPECSRPSAPLLTFRLEGHRQDHDVRYVALKTDWILEVLMTKIKFFQRVEKINMF